MSTLSGERCVACRRDSPRVTEAEIAELRREVSGWQLVERDGIARLERVFHFPSRRRAGLHQPGRCPRRGGGSPSGPPHRVGRVTVAWWTHKIRGLHRNDFIMAAKTDVLAAQSGDYA